VDVYPLLHDEHVSLWLEADSPFPFQLYGTGVPLLYAGDKGLSHRLVQALDSNQKYKQHRCLMSRSHTAGVGVMLMVREGLGISSIGVDIEAQHRKPPTKKLIRRICPAVGEYHHIKEIPTLAVWCIKEALFKAWPTNKGGVLAHLTIQSVVHDNEHAWKGTATSPQGNCYHWLLQPLQPLQAEAPSLWCAMAWKLQ
jgi:4'-phosphopantetheinyl transferase superfamily